MSPPAVDVEHEGVELGEGELRVARRVPVIIKIIITIIIIIIINKGDVLSNDMKMATMLQ